MKEMELRFIDSIKFMSSSLDSLVNNLARGGHQFFGVENYSCSKRELLVRKECTHMNIWIAGIDLKKLAYLA